jgi:dipeptidyl aminopeptidase/acylaminoacyl peptidase
VDHGHRRQKYAPLERSRRQQPAFFSGWYFAVFFKRALRHAANLPMQGGEASQVSRLPLDIGSFVLAPNGAKIAFSVAVFPACKADLACSKKRFDAPAAQKTTGISHESLFMRHWDSWDDGSKQQLFVADLASELENVRLLSTGIDGDVPSKPFGDDSEYSFSPDSKSVVFSARIAGKTEAWSTNFDLYQVPSDASSAPKNLTADNPAWDTTPVFSPDGKTLYYRAMRRAGFEADRFRILARTLANGSTREIAPNWDRSPDSLAISADGKTLYTHTDNLGNRPLFAITIKDGAARVLSGPGSVSGFAVHADGLVFARDDLDSPADLYRLSNKASTAVQISNVNQSALAALRFGAFEQFQFAGFNDHPVYAWIVKPVDFDASKRYPVAYLIHGGPQGSFGNQFHYRWNPQTYAGQGYVAIMVDFHGSTGYGQAFTDSISGDWGGKPLIDLQKGLAAAAAKYAFADTQNACALGGSYGGYMTNWIAGAWPEQFKCLVTHAGIFDKRFMSYSTEELWFVEWENQGLAWQQADAIERDNPIGKVAQWQTPMLVIHGKKDFRVPFEQGIAAFTLLQRRGIDSQFLWFPDENHWILKPHNSLQWHDAVNAWLHKYLHANKP